MSPRTEQADAGPAAPVIIAVRGLETRFGQNVIHDKLDLDVYQGEILAIVGGSGTGKTVLLNTIIGLKRPDGGQVDLSFDQPPARGRSADRGRMARNWGIMFQQGALFSALSVRENIAAPLQEYTRLKPRMIDTIVDIKLNLVGLAPAVGNLRPAELSGGMRKRVGLARALALDPKILFLDEPTAGLDPIGAAAFDELIRALSDSLDLTVVLITHDLDTLYAITDRVAVLADKRVIAAAPVRTLETSDHPWIRSYFLGPRGRAAAGAVARGLQEV